VFLTKEDREKLSNHLQLPVEQFAIQAEFNSTRFTKDKTVQWILRDAAPTCPFLRQGKCSVYEVRPTQCKTFPYWPELLEKNNFKNEAKEACPGIGKGEEKKIEPFHMTMIQSNADKELSSQTIGPE
jgi:Fe-S-cluster containining protein